MLYTTNNGAVVAHARYCYLNYPTIVNEIPKSSNHYGNTPNDFAAVDNQLAKSQLAIGESSNLAQIALTYAATFPDDDRYADIVCCLAVLAQAAID